jgi:formiminotetrahydrofolate cyclodeaminase
MRLCLDALGAAPDIAAEGSENALSDCAVAGLTLHTGFHGAAYNVQINLPELKDDGLRATAEAALQEWPARADALVGKIRATVDERMQG